jgi:hypothetical protein
LKTKIFFILMMTASAFAQDTKPEIIEHQNQKALLFSMNEFKLGAFDGGIGFKYCITDAFTLLGKIHYSYSKTDRDETERLTGDIDKDVMYGASLGFEKHFSVTKTLSPYYGATLGIGFEEKSGQVNSASSIGFFYTTEQKTSSKIISFHISLGVELYLTESISLAGQYNLGAVYSPGTEEYITPYSSTTMDVSELQGGISSGELIIAIYF